MTRSNVGEEMFIQLTLPGHCPSSRCQSRLKSRNWSRTMEGGTLFSNCLSGSCSTSFVVWLSPISLGMISPKPVKIISHRHHHRQPGPGSLSFLFSGDSRYVKLTRLSRLLAVLLLLLLLLSSFSFMRMPLKTLRKVKRIVSIVFEKDHLHTACCKIKKLNQIRNYCI